MVERNSQAEMPFLEHLEELRWRILYSLLALAIGTVVGWLVVQRFDVLDLLKRPIAPYLPGGRLTFTSPTEPFLLTLKLAFGVGALLASPVVVYQVWAFLAPALYPREKRLIVPALSVGVVLFAIGAVAAYLIVLPAALQVLFAFQREDLNAIITIDRYFGFAIPLILAFGLVTELPLVVALLAALGLVTPRFLARNRRYAIVIAAFGAALLTPPDAVSMLMMMVPLLLLYEIGILAAWVVARRRARRLREAAGSAAVLALALCAAAGPLAAQQPGRVQRPTPIAPRDTLPPGRAAADSVRRGQPIDSATARRLGLPTGPSRSFPPADSILDSLLALEGYVATRYIADTLRLEGDSQVIRLGGHALVEREGTQLEADSVRYRDAECRLDALGEPKLFDQSSVMVGREMRYDTCQRRGIVTRALTNFEQQGTDWFLHGDRLAADSGSRRIYGAGSEVTSCDLPDPHFHFSSDKVKWLNRNVMVARPAVLYVRDVPVLWMPFIFQDIRSGRRSGMLVPRFSLNDLVRTSERYRRAVRNIGYYFAISDYLDLMTAVDWHSGSHVNYRAQMQYRILDRFVNGSIALTHQRQLDVRAHSTRIGWNHSQQFSSRTNLSVGLDYATSANLVQRNSVNPFLVSRGTLNSRANFNKRFDWGTLSVGGSYVQNLHDDQVTGDLPNISLTPSAVDIGSVVTWSPALTFTNRQTFKNPGGTLLTAGGSGGGIDTLTLRYDQRETSFSFQTPLRIGRWNWTNNVAVRDEVSDRRQVFAIPDSTAPAGRREVIYGKTFNTSVDWQTGINLPQLFSGSWKLQPGVSIVNTTSGGPFMLRNQFSGGEFVRQGKRLQFGLGSRPTFFGFFPGIGPLARIRHSVSPGLDYRYAPGATVPEEYRRALDPADTSLNARSDPQQTISFSILQAFEAKLRAPAGDSSAQASARKLRLLSISTSPIEYNFELAKQPGRTGWQTQRVTNSFTSELLPNFQLSVVHNLWDGKAGVDTSRFNPSLEDVSVSFQLSASTLRAIAGLFGLVLPGARPAQAQRPGDGQAAPDTTRGQQGPVGYPGPYSQSGGLERGGGGKRPFSIDLRYSGSHGGTGGRNFNLDLGFSPTRNWSVSWSTNYDIDSQRFGHHFLRFERDLHEWQASFSFARSPNGNVAFNFYIALLHLPDIKFDYDQQTYQ